MLKKNYTVKGYFQHINETDSALITLDEIGDKQSQNTLAEFSDLNHQNQSHIAR